MFHTYSAYSRGVDLLNGAYDYLDLVPKGRDEDDFDFSMEWLMTKAESSTSLPAMHG